METVTMANKDDYNNLLLFLYRELVKEKKDGISPKDVVQEFNNWTSERINNAYAHLRDNHYIKSISLPSSYNGVFDFRIQSLYPYAIKIVEDELENKKQERLREIFSETPWETIKLIKKDQNKTLFLEAYFKRSNLILIGDTKIELNQGNIIEITLQDEAVQKYKILGIKLISEDEEVPSHYEVKVKKERL